MKCIVQRLVSAGGLVVVNGRYGRLSQGCTHVSWQIKNCSESACNICNITVTLQQLVHWAFFPHKLSMTDIPRDTSMCLIYSFDTLCGICHVKHVLVVTDSLNNLIFSEKLARGIYLTFVRITGTTIDLDIFWVNPQLIIGGPVTMLHSGTNLKNNFTV